MIFLLITQFSQGNGYLFVDLSFDTISAYGAHGAMMHYVATPETDAALKPEGFLLVGN